MNGCRWEGIAGIIQNHCNITIITTQSQMMEEEEEEEEGRV